MYTVEKHKFTFVIPPRSEEQTEKPIEVSPLDAAQSMWTDILLVSSGLGTATIVCGFGIAAASAFGLIPARGGVALLGTILLLLAFPVLGLVAHCMDKLDDLKREARKEFCRRFGLSEAERWKEINGHQ